MRVFVSEYLTCGACANRTMPESLLREGKAMLSAALSDFARIVGCRVVTTCDSRLAKLDARGVEVLAVDDSTAEGRLFGRLAADCDATFVIAPEFEGILAERRETAVEAGGRYFGCSAEAIRLCADKLALAGFLQKNGVPTIETHPCSPAEQKPACSLPAVVKPRRGAGSQDMFLIENEADLRQLQRQRPEQEWYSKFICQPYIAGQAISIAAIVSRGKRESLEVFPPAEQRLSHDGRFRYLGGCVPASLVEAVGAGVTVAADIASAEAANDSQPERRISPGGRLVQQVCKLLPGLAGYVGFDLILPQSAPDRPLLVEINPRLTTSYVGYRRLTDDNLAERMLFPERPVAKIHWMPRRATYSPDGTVAVESMPAP